MSLLDASLPVLTSEQALAQERSLFGGDEAREWKAMQAAGRAVAAAVLADLAEAGGMPARSGRLLVLAGKGHNGGDALIAARTLLELCPGASAQVVFAFGSRALRPLAARAWRELCDGQGARVVQTDASAVAGAYDLCLDGIFGLQYRPPLAPQALAALEAAAAVPVRLRAAVDLPSGVGCAGGFSADFTYATGSAKTALLGCGAAGRPRMLDLGFFERERGPDAQDRVLLRRILEPLRGLRPHGADKRSQGHVAIVGGSGRYPGAVMLAALGALRSGAGLVTVFVPASLAPAYAAQAPDAMWVGLPETPDGFLARVGSGRVLSGLSRASALVIGPGLGKDPEPIALVRDVLEAAQVPCVMDADALQPDLVRAPGPVRILTPHAGEFARIAEGAPLRAFARDTGTHVVLKGPVTAVCSGATVYHSFFGGPVLARGGSGDVLAGLTGGLLAQASGDPMLAACRAVVWHGAAADALARSRGQAAARTLDLPEFLPAALRD